MNTMNLLTGPASLLGEGEMDWELYMLLTKLAAVKRGVTSQLTSWRAEVTAGPGTLAD